MARKAHPNLFEFVEVLQKEQAAAEVTTEQISGAFLHGLVSRILEVCRHEPKPHHRLKLVQHWYLPHYNDVTLSIPASIHLSIFSRSDSTQHWESESQEEEGG